LKVDPAAVRVEQIRKLEQLKSERDGRLVAEKLDALTEGAKGRANLLGLAIEAARAKATVGEISFALEKSLAAIAPRSRPSPESMRKRLAQIRRLLLA